MAFWIRTGFRAVSTMMVMWAGYVGIFDEPSLEKNSSLIIGYSAAILIHLYAKDMED